MKPRAVAFASAVAAAVAVGSLTGCGGSDGEVGVVSAPSAQSSAPPPESSAPPLESSTPPLESSVPPPESSAPAPTAGTQVDLPAEPEAPETPAVPVSAPPAEVGANTQEHSSEPEAPVDDPEPVDASASGSQPELALEVVEPLGSDPGSSGGARQVEPVEPAGSVEQVGQVEVVEPAGQVGQVEPVKPAGQVEVEQVEQVGQVEAVEPAGSAQPAQSDGAAGYGGEAEPQGEVYTWQDGDRTRTVWLRPDLAVLEDGAVTKNDEIVADAGFGQVVGLSAGSAQADGGAQGSGRARIGQPVFVSEGGTLMALPGGVVLILDPQWDTDDTDAFFADNGILLDRVSELDFAANGFSVDTDAGFASLELANALAGQPGVELSSPNWWRERSHR